MSLANSVPHAQESNVCVLGAGVMGLSVALRLRQVCRPWLASGWLPFCCQLHDMTDNACFHLEFTMQLKEDHRLRLNVEEIKVTKLS